MAAIDQRGVLNDDVFRFHSSKDGKVFITWHGKTVKVLKGNAAHRFLAQVTGADHHEVQLVMAKATGNFKHGNER